MRSVVRQPMSEKSETFEIINTTVCICYAHSGSSDLFFFAYFFKESDFPQELNNSLTFLYRAETMCVCVCDSFLTLTTTSHISFYQSRFFACPPSFFLVCSRPDFVLIDSQAKLTSRSQTCYTLKLTSAWARFEPLIINCLL